MNGQVLKQAAKRFLTKYPGGFAHPEMVAMGKKHKMDKLVAEARANFAKARFNDEAGIVASAATMVSRSSMVSMFEKPKFKSLVGALGKADKVRWARVIHELLHGKEKVGFEALVDELGRAKLAKWTLVTVLPAYFRPTKDVFIKPTTAKLIIDTLELDGLKYSPTPTWDFYRRFRASIKSLKAEVNPSLAPSNAAFCGFLMMGLGGKV